MLTKIRTWITLFLISVWMLPQSAAASDRAQPVTDEINRGIMTFLSEYRIIIAGVVGVGVLSGLLAFVYLLTKLAAVADQPKERADVLKELLMVGVTTSLLGAFSFVVATYYSIMING